jgi:hypothetical protein
MSRALIGYCLMAVSMPALMAQVEPGEEVIDTSAWTRIEGKDVPDYVVVSKFFDTVAIISEMGEERYHAFARTFGFSTQKGSCCPLEILTRASQEARLATKGRLVDERLLNDPVAFMEYQKGAVRERARKLGEVYGQFLAELEEAGMPIESFMKTLDAQVRPGVVLFTDGDPEEEVVGLQLDNNFYQGMESCFSLELKKLKE